MAKIKAKQVALNHTHIAIVDSRGLVWERFVGMKDGAWFEVPLPEDPHPVDPRKRPLSKPTRLKP